MSDGLEITNTNATTSVPSNYEMDDRTGFRVLPGVLIRDGQTGIYVTKRSYDPRHPQELVRSRTDRLEGSRSPEQTDVFLAVNEVKAEDL